MLGKRKRIYLDYASATPVLPAAARAQARAAALFANPGALHAEGVAAKELLARSREGVAAQLGVKAREVIFTSGLTESNNLAILRFAREVWTRRVHASLRPLEGTHWIASSIEHDSVLDCFDEIERMGGLVTHVGPERNGVIAAEQIERAIRPTTAFVSVGWGNNEIGTIQPLSAIARILREEERGRLVRDGSGARRIIFHSDAGQAPLYRVPHAHTLGVDLFSLGSGKLYGPRGVGALYVSNRAQLAPAHFGGRQERGLRSGTEDVALAAGFAEALERIAREREGEAKRLRELRDGFAQELLARIPGAVVNGDLKHALPHMLNISIPGSRSGEYLALALDHVGIALSSKSACREGEASSHVVAALRGEAWRSQHSLRFSLGRESGKRDIALACDALEKIIAEAAA